MNQTQALQTFFGRRGMTGPDGRPLFGYRLEGNELARFGGFVRQMLQGIARGERYQNFDPLFCLYAAETFRREHAGGSWAWETVFRPLGVTQPTHPMIHRWVEHGLRWWRRPLMHGHDGMRLFLVTVACEGGLPLRLLLQQNARLHTYFTELLEDYHRAGCLGEGDAYARAKKLSHRLPATHRQDVVFQLGSRLVLAAVELWQAVGDVPDPIAALDKQITDWRLRLPLSADDATVNAILAPLMSRVTGLAQAATARLRWRGLLRETNPGEWTVEKVLDLPDTVDGAILRHWLNLGQDQPLPTRLRVLLCDGSDSEAVAWLTRGRGDGDRVLYRREWLRRDGLRLSGSALVSPHDLALDDGQHLTPLHASLAEPWADSLPWVFIEMAGVRVWQSQGTARTRSEMAWVVIPASLRPEVEGVDTCRLVGKTAGLDLLVYEVRTAALFTSLLGDCYRVTCGAPHDTDESYFIFGNTLAGTLGPRVVYQGLPAIKVEDTDGSPRPPAGQRQWRRVGGTGPWRNDLEGAGLLWLRQMDTQGAERYRRQVAVVPRRLRIERTIAQSGGAGSYRFSGLGGGQASVHAYGESVIDATASGPDEATVVCPAIAGTNLPLLAVEICWGDGQPVNFNVPYPQRGAVFLMGGRTLTRDAAVPVDRCGGLRLVVIDPAGSGRYDLDGELIGTRFGFRSRLPPLQDGRLDLSLHACQDRLSALLASQGDLDAGIRVAVTLNQQRLAQVLVMLFDATIVPGAQRDRVYVQTDSPDRLDSGWQERLALSALPLWDPPRSARQLECCPDEPFCWILPEDLDPGPWWVIGRERDWVRFRPLLWPVAAVDESGLGVESPLAEAICEPDKGVRQQHLSEVVAVLGSNPDDPDWPRLFAYIDLTREFSPSALHILRELPGHPRTLAMALLRAGDDAFERVWSLAEGLPFLWWLIPVEDWLAASADYLATVQDALGDADADGELVVAVLDGFRNRAQSRHQAFNPLCDWLQEHLVPWKPLGHSLLRVIRAQPALLNNLVAGAEGELQARHGPGETWPIGAEILDRAKVMSFSQFRFGDRSEPFRPVRCAPFVAADAAIHGSDFDGRLVLELRLIRIFDQEWFDAVYTFALALGLAALPPEVDV
ncbi:MAG: STY4851/ECs_5259 family protein [Chromatiaceae bacterium]|nr:STY4851/ECs_5259 family protein [Chromatiaceae bacterium]